MSRVSVTWEEATTSSIEGSRNPEGKPMVCVCGAGGFIAGHLAKRLVVEGNYVIAVDWKPQEFFKGEKFCDEFKLLDLRTLVNCKKATEGCTEVYNLACDMGGMGFIQSNESVLFYNNMMISFNVMEAARSNGAKKLFYSSSACVYNEEFQEGTENCSLKECMAWPAKPQDNYGLEKLCTEQLCQSYGNDFNMQVRIARFHNIYGENGTWKGGREKAPAAFARKSLTSFENFEMWGDGHTTRSFMHVDDCVEGIMRLMDSDYKEPINLGSDRMISMNDFAELVMGIVGNIIPIEYVPGPQGVRGRNSDNTLIKSVLGWEPQISLEDGMKRTIDWIDGQLKQEIKNGQYKQQYTSSEIVQQSTESLEKL